MSQPFRSVEKHWQEFRDILGELSALQAAEMRQAFFAGFSAAFATVTQLCDVPSDDGAAKSMDQFFEELQQFAQSMLLKLRREKP